VELRGVDQLDAGRDFEAAGPADNEIAPDASLLDRLDQELRIAGGEMDRAHDRVMASEKLDQARLVEDVAFLRRHGRAELAIHRDAKGFWPRLLQALGGQNVLHF